MIKKGVNFLHSFLWEGFGMPVIEKKESKNAHAPSRKQIFDLFGIPMRFRLLNHLSKIYQISQVQKSNYQKNVGEHFPITRRKCTENN